MSYWTWTLGFKPIHSSTTSFLLGQAAVQCLPQQHTNLAVRCHAWLLVGGLMDVSCSAADVLGNPKKAAKSAASNAWNLDRMPAGHLAGCEEKAGGQQWRAVTPLGWGGVSPKLLPIHSPCVCSSTSSQRGQALSVDTHQGFPAPTPLVTAKDWGFCLLQSETIWETQMLSKLSLLTEGGLCFCVAFWKSFDLTSKELQECHADVFLLHLENKLTKSH